MADLIRIHPRDNVAVALRPIAPGTETPWGPSAEIPQGHKMALEPIVPGAPVIKYGFPIGCATAPIKPGQWVHTHNLKTALSEGGDYTYTPVQYRQPPARKLSFQGYLRPDGRAATRNEIWIIPTVGCVNGTAQALAARCQDLREGSLEGIYAFPHPYGCSQMGDDHARTRKLLAALCRHPNAGGVLVLGLGCENNTADAFRQELGEYDPARVRFLVCQQVEDELAEGRRLLEELAAYCRGFRRQSLPLDKLVVGMKCGGSDGLSGITANPTVGAFSDQLIACGGSSILTEVPEMFGAEQLLLNRCRDPRTFEAAVAMIDGFKRYFTAHGQVVYENPSPGNKAGGITTLEDKSLGCVQKGGTAPVNGVLDYGDSIRTPGLNLLYGPGNDLVSTTALTAAGAQLILFTTGRGTPFGAPVPTIKISTNDRLSAGKAGWIDFSAGPVADGEPVPEAAERLLQYVIAVASGEQTAADRRGYREIAIFKDGVTM